MLNSRYRTRLYKILRDHPKGISENLLFEQLSNPPKINGTKTNPRKQK